MTHRPIRIGAALAMAWALGAALGCAPSFVPHTPLEHEIAVRCANCHAVPKPGRLSDARAHAIMQDHWKRAHLTEAQGDSIAVWLSTPK